ncbi:hypothetical protein O6H91_07G132200 [Diphasiastrum complanatum]|uniref:Uncharacterized protein n=1 Tax=Diphasiastrum complanatum TaxID=34168 RepID=A0ACC2D9Z8_DIPCM|nr:hypothetical protein O6H91_07G132200 [Diphasiastrum complanatum]
MAVYKSFLSTPSDICALLCSGDLHSTGDCRADFPISEWLHRVILQPCFQRTLFSAFYILFFVGFLSLAFYKFRKASKGNGHHQTVAERGNKWVLLIVLTLLVILANTLLSLWLAWLGFQKIWHVAIYEILFSATESATWMASLLILAPKREPSSPFCMTLPTLRAWWIVNFLSSSFVVASAICSYVAGEMHSRHVLVSDVVALATLLITLVMLLLSRGGLIRRSATRSKCSDLAEPLLPDQIQLREALDAQKLTGYANAGVVSKALFLWLNPLLALGSRTAIQTDDVPCLKKEDNCEHVFEAFQEKWKWQSGSKSLAFALLGSLWLMFVVTGCLAVVKLCVMYVGPLMIQQFIDFTAKKDGSWTEGTELVLLLFVAKCTEVLTDHQRNFISAKLSLAAKSILIAAVYRKSLRLSTAARQKHGTGQIVNYMSVDVQEVATFTTNIHDLWIMPLQIIMALAILFRVVGISTLAGLGTMVVILTICLFIASYQQHFWLKIMASKDSRLKVTNEALANMKIIKMQAWQDWFCQKIEDARRTELSWISKIMYLASVSIFLLWLSPLAVSVITFGTCVLLKIQLTAGRVFTAIATFRILQEPLRSFPSTIMAAAQAYVSLKRLVNYFESEELDQGAVQKLPYGEDFAITIKGASFKWQRSSEKCILTNINLQARPGSLVAIIGTVGSGKSGLLACILGEMEKLSGTVIISGQTAYVAQTAWIQNGTIQENILFGKPMNQALYQKTLRACALKSDLSQMPHGDQTEIGERGINLSGGQKQRIQLARAVYQDADIYLLDDVFSAVDAHTGTKLFWECIRGALASKTVLLVTHQVEFLHGADCILVMKEGEIVQSGKYEDLLKYGVDFGALIDAHNTALNSMNMEEAGSEGSGVDTNLHANYSMSPGSAFILAAQGSPFRNAVLSPLSSSPSALARQVVFEKQISQRRSINSEDSKKMDVIGKNSNLIEEEERATGRVDKAVYWAYATKVFGGAHVIILILIQTGWQALQIASDFWLADATSSKNQANFKPTRFITVYTGLAIGSGIFVLIRAMLISFASLKTTQAFYLTMLRSVFHAPMSFFDTTPTGRILSRSSTDQVTVDFDVPFGFGTVLAVGFQMLGVLFVTSCITWELVLVVLPMAWISLSYQRYFIATSRELTRLGSITQAPVIHHFSETISGFMTVRAFGYEEKFNDVNNERVNTNLRITFHNAAANEWFGARIEILGICLLCSSALLLVLLPKNFIQPELVGLSLSYGLAINDTLFYVVLFSSQLEQKMVSVERILQYTGLTKEQPAETENKHPNEAWPNHGSIAVQGLQLRYRPDTPLVLKGLTFTIRGGEKLGIVGLTGSGKSSIIQALFRLVEPAGGKILIDGVDITTISLNDLRSRISIIPQEPTLFEGSIRSNMDPLGKHTDQEIWEVLEKCQLATYVREKEDRLDSQVAENGENWSMGQRQLFCLGRALLKHSRILILDEATASVDTQTDLVLQNTIKFEFSSCTIISIAHRIPSVMDSDKVLALESGKVKEFGSPAALMQQPSSLFASLVHEYWNRSRSTQSVQGASDNAVQQ